MVRIDSLSALEHPELCAFFPAPLDRAEADM